MFGKIYLPFWYQLMEKREILPNVYRRRFWWNWLLWWGNWKGVWNCSYLVLCLNTKTCNTVIVIQGTGFCSISRWTFVIVYCQVSVELVRNHLCSLYAEFSEKLTFLISRYAQRNVNFPNVRNEWSRRYLSNNVKRRDR